MKLMCLLPAVLCTVAVSAQTNHGRTSKEEVLLPTSLHVEGLTYEREIDRIYWGDFEHLHLDRSGFEFGSMLSAYMQNYGQRCPNSLPANKVELMDEECDGSGWHRVYAQTGVEVPGSFVCGHYIPVHTGIYADPALYNASQFEGAKMASGMLGQLGQTLSKSGDAGVNAALGNDMEMMDVARELLQFKSDLNQLLAANECGGAPLRRFQANLVAYATDKPPIRMPGIPTPPATFHDSDYQTLLEDVVGEQAKGWMLNRYIPNTIANVAVGGRDGVGHPTSVTAKYAYQGSRGRIEGQVELRFSNGEPHCLVFSDIPDACRAVDHRLAANYEDGKYVTNHPAEARTYVAPDLRQVDIVVGGSQPVLVEVPGEALNLRQGIVIPTHGKLPADVLGPGPGGGTVVLVRAGSPVNLTVLNSQRGAQFYLVQAGSDASHAVRFSGTSAVLHAGVDPLPRDGSPLRVSFDPGPNIRTKMLLTDYQKQQTTSNASPTAVPPPAPVSAGAGGSFPRRVESPAVGPAATQRILPAGTPLELQFASVITTDQVAGGKLFPTTLIARNSPMLAARGATLPNGTVVFVRISPGTGDQYLIQADHAVVEGANLPLESNAQARVAQRSSRPAATQIRVPGGFRLSVPRGGGQSAVLVPASTVIQLSTQTDVAVSFAPR